MQLNKETLEEPKQDFPQIRTKEFNDLASACFGGKPKQETIEEAAERLAKKYGYDIEGGAVADFVDGVVRGANLQAERMYSEGEVLVLLHKRDKHNLDNPNTFNGWKTPKEWFEQFKKK